MPIRLLVVDAHSLVRQGLRLFLARDPDFEIVGEVAEGQEAIRQAALLRPDLIVIDLMLPTQDGLKTIAALHQYSPSTPVIVLSTVLKPLAVMGALRAGASGYLSKDILARDLRAALKAAAAGQAQFSPAVSVYVIEADPPANDQQPPGGC